MSVNILRILQIIEGDIIYILKYCLPSLRKCSTPNCHLINLQEPFCTEAYRCLHLMSYNIVIPFNVLLAKQVRLLIFTITDLR